MNDQEVVVEFEEETSAMEDFKGSVMGYSIGVDSPISM